MTEMSFDEALRVLGVRRTAGPVEAQQAYERLILRCGPGVPKEVREQLEQAWRRVESPGAWPTSAFDEVVVEQGGKRAGDPRQPDRKRPVTDFLRARLDARRRLAKASLASVATAEVSAPLPIASLDPEVLGLVETVASMSTVLDTDELFAALDRGQIDGPMTALRTLLSAGEMQALGRLAAGLLDQMCERPDREWFEPKTLLRLNLRLHAAVRTNPEALGAAAEIQRALDRYKRSPGNRRVAYDIQTSARWRWSSELAALGPDFPPEARALIAEATASGGAHEAKAELDLWLRKNRAPGLAVAAKLRLACPSLAELYADVLPAADPSGAGGQAGAAQATTRPTAASGASRSTATTRPTGVVKARPQVLSALGEVPAWVWVVAVLAVGGALDLPRGRRPSHAQSPLAADLAFAREHLCSAFGQGTPGCSWAAVVADGLERGDCEMVDKALPRLNADLQQLEMSAGVRQRASAAAAAMDSPREVVNRLENLRAASCPQS
ncbi:MAG: hypothetical protein R3F39_25040 [Myxococcota bacterium]